MPPISNAPASRSCAPAPASTDRIASASPTVGSSPPATSWWRPAAPRCATAVSPARTSAATSEELFHWPHRPERVVVIGGGAYVALEFASLLAGLGSKVTVLYRGEGDPARLRRRGPRPRPRRPRRPRPRRRHRRHARRARTPRRRHRCASRPAPAARSRRMPCCSPSAVARRPATSGSRRSIPRCAPTDRSR